MSIDIKPEFKKEITVYSLYFLLINLVVYFLVNPICVDIYPDMPFSLTCENITPFTSIMFLIISFIILGGIFFKHKYKNQSHPAK